MPLTTPDLFDICANRHGGVPTSRAANRSLCGVKGELRRKVYDYIKAHPLGVTLEEVSIALDMKIQTASARVSELLRDHFIADTGKRRATTSGRAARVLA